MTQQHLHKTIWYLSILHLENWFLLLKSVWYRPNKIYSGRNKKYIFLILFKFPYTTTAKNRHVGLHVPLHIFDLPTCTITHLWFNFKPFDPNRLISGTQNIQTATENFLNPLLPWSAKAICYQKSIRNLAKTQTENYHEGECVNRVLCQQLSSTRLIPNLNYNLSQIFVSMIFLI